VSSDSASTKIVDNEPIDPSGNISNFWNDLAVDIVARIDFQVVGEDRMAAEVLRLPQTGHHSLVLAVDVAQVALDIGHLVVLGQRPIHRHLRSIKSNLNYLNQIISLRTCK
jgi:hypothetical protein